MKNFTGLFFILSLANISLAQDEKAHQCYAKFKNQHAKSNTLNVAQIALTEKYDVYHYQLDLAMSNLNTDVAGTVEIHAKAKENLDSALFELFNTFTISALTVNGSPVTYSRQNSAIKVPVNANTNDAFVIAITYNGTAPTASTNPLGGSGLTNDNSPSWGNQVTWTLSEPYSAFEWFPCKQSLKDKIDSVTVMITVPSACKAGSNGLLVNETNLGNGTTKFTWKHKHPIAYYLISVAVAEYIDYTVYANPVGAPGPIPIVNYIYNNPNTLTNFQADIDETVDFLELFSNKFGLYPFYDEKYGHCMAPLSGGMEHQTMTTQGFFEASLTSHELAHQWFGDNVTCASWTDIWVNEGFASYAEYIMLENIYPGSKAQDMLTRHNNIMSSPGGSIWVLDSLNQNSVFDSRLVYDKGAAFVHILRFMTNNDNQFFQGLKNYQVNFKDSFAMAVDIKNELLTASGKDFTSMFDQWYYGEGFPTYSSKYNNIGNDLLLQVKHTVSRPTITPTFTNDLEIKLIRSGLPDTIIRVAIQSNQDEFIINNCGTVTGMTFDPNNWIINKSGGAVKDPTYVLGIEENDMSAFQIYPNPSNDGIFKLIDQSNLTSKVVVYNAKGQEVSNQEINTAKQFQILENGIYIVELKDQNNQTLLRKLIVKN